MRVDGRGVQFPEPSKNHITRVTFDNDGHLVESDRLDPPSANPFDNAFASWLTEKFGYRPGMIWMREFIEPNGIKLRLWRAEQLQWMSSSQESKPDEDDSDPADLGRFLWEWLHQGYYLLGWGDENSRFVDRFAARAFIV
jgi:hypothetical protein